MPLQPAARFDAAIIGSGPNGLAAALALAEAGRSVVVYEARDTVGGGARTAELSRPGFHHDLCSSVHPMGVGSPYLRTLPLAEHGLEWVHPELPAAHVLPGGQAVALHRELAATVDTLGRDGAGWARLVGPFVDRWFDLAADALGPLGIPRSPWLMLRFGLRAMMPATWLARATLKTEAGRALLAGMAGHSIVPLDRPPSAAIGLMLAIAGHAVGWPVPRGGAQALSDAMARLARARGVEIRTSTPITALHQIETTGPVLFETGPRAMARIVGDTLPTAYVDKLSHYRYGPGAFKLDWALDGPIPWTAPDARRAATIHLGDSLDEIAASERDAWEGRHSERPFMLIVQPTVCDPSRAPAGQHTAWGYCHVPNGSDRDLTELLEARIEAHAPGFRDRVLARVATGTAALERYNPNYVGGDVNGGAPTLDQLFTRPVARLVPYSTPNPRLWICSSSSPPGGGIHGMCGWHAARAVLRRWPGRGVV